MKFIGIDCRNCHCNYTLVRQDDDGRIRICRMCQAPETDFQQVELGEHILIQVELRAFTGWDGPKERPVWVPKDQYESADEYGRLALVFTNGQNDCQPSSECYSVSMGDVIRLPDGTRYSIEGVGFKKIVEDPQWHIKQFGGSF